ncbi:hypothetical protein O1R50_15710 [Glycomyces luteolus]|uniref:Uncharacterized protein n=1 Tax=Glycomyces luteolus TaxID=2670330 RepID=A0A9X3SR89_9ACTN|nr:hypothetical protein [Glycomyces luteolus]MDA1361076.1 hypothetical protein [Glycomyces luteolus]
MLIISHFIALWMVDLPSRHGGRPGDLGWALIWTFATAALAAVAVTGARSPRAERPARDRTALV